MKQSCYFAKLCDGEFNKKLIGVKLKTLCEKGTQFVSRCWGLLLEDFRAIGRTFDVAKIHDFVTKSKYHMYFSFKYLCRVSEQNKDFSVQ